jgi:glycosyltransferase involved in cell wall biosynthesis
MKILLAKDGERKIELWIAGEGEEMTSLEQLSCDLGVANKVKFFGRVAHENVVAHFQTADVFCLPSLNEGMSNTMLEALASGMPIVATVTGGTEELVGNGENGFFIKQHSAEDIAEKLEVLIGDDTLRLRFGEASRTRALAMSWGKVAESYNHLYQKAIQKI